MLVESADPPGRFAFSHALVNHTLYEALGPTRRARLHRRVAEALEELCGDDPGARLGELAQHWARGHGHDRRAQGAVLRARARRRRRWPTWRPPRRCAGSSARWTCSTDRRRRPGRPLRSADRPGRGQAPARRSGLPRRAARGRRDSPATWATPTAWPARRWPTPAARSARSARSTSEQVEMIEAALELAPEDEPALPRAAAVGAGHGAQLRARPPPPARAGRRGAGARARARATTARSRTSCTSAACRSSARTRSTSGGRWSPSCASWPTRFGDPELRFWAHWLPTYGGEDGDFDGGRPAPAPPPARSPTRSASPR